MPQFFPQILGVLEGTLQGKGIVDLLDPNLFANIMKTLLQMLCYNTAAFLRCA